MWCEVTDVTLWSDGFTVCQLCIVYGLFSLSTVHHTALSPSQTSFASAGWKKTLGKSICLPICDRSLVIFIKSVNGWPEPATQGGSKETCRLQMISNTHPICSWNMRFQSHTHTGSFSFYRMESRWLQIFSLLLEVLLAACDLWGLAGDMRSCWNIWCFVWSERRKWPWGFSKLQCSSSQVLRAVFVRDSCCSRQLQMVLRSPPTRTRTRAPNVNAH